MFVCRWNRMNGKLWRENGKKNFFEVCLIGWEWRKINGGVQVFFLSTHQKFSLQNRKKTGGKLMKWIFKNTPYVGLYLHRVGFIYLFFPSLFTNVHAFFFFSFDFSSLFTNVLGFFFVFVFSSLSLILSGRVSFLHIFFFLGTHMFISLLILVGFCFYSPFFF